MKWREGGKKTWRSKNYVVRESENRYNKNVRMLNLYCHKATRIKMSMKISASDVQKNPPVTCRQWGLFTKWRRSGSGGTVAHGCMLDVWLVVCSRETLTFAELLFAPFAWIRLGWYLQTIAVFEELENQATERVRASYFYFFFGSVTVSSVGLRTRYNSAERLVVVCWHGLRFSAASDTFAWVLFSTQKRVPHLAFWLFWFCVCD